MSLKDIKLRMDAIKKTATITQAMHNIALSKIRKSTDLSDHTLNFSSKLLDILKYANENTDGISRYCEPIKNPNKLYILVTADRGLCGSYHNQLFKLFLADTKDMSKSNYQVLAIGKKGFYFAQKNDLPMINDEVVYHRDDLVTMSMRSYADVIKKAYEEGYVDEVIIYHNHYVNTASQQVVKKSILPLVFDEEKIHSQFIYDAAPEVVMDRTVRIYVEAKMIEALADAKLSEHASRMVAMKNATDNANQIVDRLHMQYHRARQQEITSELIDVVNGSNV
ncbi:MAG: ATP synthase F1 subunit gamma [Acholeplasmataceae bacterium]